MEKNVFIEKMSDILDVEDEITMDTKLDELEEWDSLSIVSYVAMANTSCGKRIDGHAPYLSGKDLCGYSTYSI